mgnify:FL=1
MLQSPDYLVPFSEQSRLELAAGLHMLVKLGTVHLYSLLYAVGAYSVGLFLASRLLDRRKEKVLMELNRSEI